MKKIILALSVLSTATTNLATAQSSGLAGVAAKDPSIMQAYLANMSNSTKNYLTVKKVEVVDVTSQYPDQRNITLASLSRKSALNTSVFQKSEALLSAPMEKKAASLQAAGVIATLEAADVIVDKVINIGTKVWNVVEKGQPVQNYENTAASAIPQNITDWRHLEGYNDPQTKVIKVIYKNFLGMEVVNFTYRVTVVSGGSYHGVGKYIGYAAVEPVTMTTSYLYNFDAKASVDNVFNKGTEGNPVAGMVLNVRWDVWTSVSKGHGSHQFYLDGNGNIKVAAGQ